MKNYQGKLIRDKETNEDYRFSDEREWRYVPKTKDAKMVIPHKGYRTEIQKDNANSKIDKLRLGFSPNDITYIIIKDESEIKKFIDVLRSAKGLNYSLHEVERLITRIITVEQINSDFWKILFSTKANPF